MLDILRSSGKRTIDLFPAWIIPRPRPSNAPSVAAEPSPRESLICSKSVSSRSLSARCFSRSIRHDSRESDAVCNADSRSACIIYTKAAEPVSQKRSSIHVLGTWSSRPITAYFWPLATSPKTGPGACWTCPRSGLAAAARVDH